MRLINQTFLKDFVLLGFPVYEEFQALQLFAFLMIYLLSLACNLLIIVVVYKDSSLHSPMYFLISAFSFLEICYTSVTMPRLLKDLYSQNKAISTFLCVSQFYFLFAFGSTENFLLSAMAYDRYAAICHPLRYANIVTRKVCVLFVLGSWMGGFLAPAMPVVFFSKSSFCGSSEIDHFYCDFPPLLHHVCKVNEIYKVETIFFLLACAVILGNLLFISLSYAFVIATVCKIPSSGGRKKTLSTCGSHFIVVCMFYGSIIFMYVRSDVRIPTKIDKFVSLFYCVMTPTLNPMIYALRNKKMKESIKKTGKIILLNLN